MCYIIERDKAETSLKSTNYKNCIEFLDVMSIKNLILAEMLIDLQGFHLEATRKLLPQTIFWLPLMLFFVFWGHFKT